MYSTYGKSKKQVCLENKSIAYYFICSDYGLIVKYIEHSIDTYIYCVVGNIDKKSYHKLKVYYDNSCGPYIKLHGYKCYLNDFLVMEDLRK